MSLGDLRHGGTADADLQKDLELLVLAPTPAPLDTQNLAQHGSSEQDTSLTTSLCTCLSSEPLHQAGGFNRAVTEYLLTLPLDQDSDFDLTFTAFAEELSNGDTENGSATIDIIYEYNSATTGLQFEANDQSIWSQGDEFVFDNTTFIGLDTGNFDETLNAGPFTAGISGNIRVGLESTLHFEGGDIDATADYDVTIETNYNKTVDELLIETSSLLTDTFFSTMGPTGFYQLDFVWDILIDAFAGVNVDLGSIDFDPAGIIPGDQTVDFGSINETASIPTIEIGPGSFTILDLTSDDLGGTIDFPPPADFLSLDWAWPNISTTSDPAPLNPAESEGASNNFLQLNLGHRRPQHPCLRAPRVRLPDRRGL